MEVTTNAVSFIKKEFNYQPNLITESRQEFSDLEKSIFSLVINQLRKEVAVSWVPDKNLDFIIPVSELTDKKHDRVKSAVESLMSKKITQDFGEKGKMIDNREVYFDSFVPFPRVQYYKSGKQTYIRLTMLAHTVPYFIELGKHYTRYSLEIILSLKSVYSQRFYEVIMMHVGRNQRTFSYDIERLKFMFDCPENYTFKEIKRWALSTAQKELQEKAGLVFEYEPTKKDGKKIIELTFNVKTNLEIGMDALIQEANDYKKATPLERRDYVTRLLNNYSFTRKQQDEIISDEEKMAIFMQIDSEIYNKIRVVENPTAYIARSIFYQKK